MHRGGNSWAVIAFIVPLAACSKPAPADTGPEPATLSLVKVAGSTAVLPLTTEAANRFMRAHPGAAVQVEGGGSRLGLAQVADGGIAIGTSDIFAAKEATTTLEDHRIAVVGFAAMANRGPFNETITSLTMAQLRGILSGQIRNWAEVGGTSQPIVVINRPKNSGTRAAVGSIVLGGDGFAAGSEEQESSALIQTSLLEKVGAISYLALSYRHEKLKTFALDGVEPTPETIASGAYPIWSYEHMYTRGPASGAVRDFIDFVLSPGIQTALVPTSGFIPIAGMRVSRDHD
jgi:phosphate transport system substrate-binding protein